MTYSYLLLRAVTHLVGRDARERHVDNGAASVLRECLDQACLASAWWPVQQQAQLVRVALDGVPGIVLRVGVCVRVRFSRPSL